MKRKYETMTDCAVRTLTANTHARHRLPVREHAATTRPRRFGVHGLTHPHVVTYTDGREARTPHGALELHQRRVKRNRAHASRKVNQQRAAVARRARQKRRRTCTS